MLHRGTDMKPLEGITILEFSTMITAALASMMLAEQGARVIKVEPSDGGDPMRYIGARKGDISSLFACLLYTSPSPRDQRGARMPSSA